MTNKQKLKALAVILFALIVILIGMLIYATKIYNQDKDNQASNTTVPSTDTASEASPSAVQPSESSPVQTEETIELKLYYYDAEDYDNPKEIVNIKVDKKLYEQDIAAAINKVLEKTGLRINKVVVNGDFITVDLPKEVAAKFNMGSAGGITNTNTLVMTVLNLPGINILQITVDEVPNIEGDHFNFNGTYTKSADGKKFEFTSSGRQGDSINF